MSSAPTSFKTAAIISTGDELVQGRTVDTNASFIADRLASVGIEVVTVVTVGDFSGRIEEAWRDSLARAPVVISTGGLGPTADDLTTETISRVAGVDLHLDDSEAERIRQIFEAMGRTMPDNNLKQAMIPDGATIIPNALGTAPGYRLPLEASGSTSTAVVLPGVPREMKAMLDQDVVPWLVEQTDGTRFFSRTFQTFGMSESALDEALEGAVDESEGRLSFRASFPQIAVRVMVSADEETDAQRQLDALSETIRSRLGGTIFAEGDETMEAVVGTLLRDAGKTLATAESCTGGLIGNRITNVAGSSTYYMGGVVSYSNEMKQDSLGVSPSTIAMFGAVSEETACEMAQGARKLTGADIAVATTGIAGPEGGTPEKPVGTVALAIAADEIGDDGVASRMYSLRGTRDWVKTLTAQVALDWVRRHLLGLDPLEANFGKRARPRRT